MSILCAISYIFPSNHVCFSLVYLLEPTLGPCGPIGPWIPPSPWRPYCRVWQWLSLCLHLTDSKNAFKENWQDIKLLLYLFAADSSVTLSSPEPRNTLPIRWCKKYLAWKIYSYFVSQSYKCVRCICVQYIILCTYYTVCTCGPIGPGGPRSPFGPEYPFRSHTNREIIDNYV